MGYVLCIMCYFFVFFCFFFLFSSAEKWFYLHDGYSIQKTNAKSMNLFFPWVLGGGGKGDNNFGTTRRVYTDV